MARKLNNVTKKNTSSAGGSSAPRKLTNVKIKDTYRFGLEESAKDSFNKLQEYQNRRKNNDYMSAEELSAYRQARYDYDRSSKRLSSIYKASGGTDDQEEQRNKWLSDLDADMNSANEIYSKYKSADEYGKAVKESGYLSKYQGKSYAELQNELTSLRFSRRGADVEQDKALSDEIEWLKNYSATDRGVIDTMTLEDLQGLKGDAEKRNAAIEARERELEAMLTRNSRALERGKTVNGMTRADIQAERKALREEKQSVGVLYYDDNGNAVTVDQMIGYGKARGDVENIKSDTATNYLYDNLMALDNFGVTFSDLATELRYFSAADEASVKDLLASNENRDRYYALAKANGIDLNRPVWEVEEDIEQAQRKIDGYVSRMEDAGYNWDDIKGYYKYVSDRNLYAANQEQEKEYAKDHPVMATLENIVASPFQVTDLVGNIGEGAYGLTNVYDDDTVNSIAAKQEGVTELIDESVDSDVWSWIWSTAYSGVTSSLQSAATAAACTALFGPAGQAVSLGLLGSQAAASSFNQAVKNGSTNGEALSTALVSGIAEAAFEKVPLDKLFGAAKHLDTSSVSKLIWSALKQTGKQSLIEGLEEAGTNIVNTIADNAINGDHSQYYTTIEKLVRDGYTREEAEKSASKEWWLGLAGDFVGGLFGGLGSGVTANAGGAVANYVNAKMNGQLSTVAGTGIKSDTANLDSLIKTAETLIDKKGYSLNKDTSSVSQGLPPSPQGEGLAEVAKALKSMNRRGSDINVGILARAVNTALKSEFGKAETVEELDGIKSKYGDENRYVETVYGEEYERITGERYTSSVTADAVPPFPQGEGNIDLQSDAAETKPVEVKGDVVTTATDKQGDEIGVIGYNDNGDLVTTKGIVPIDTLEFDDPAYADVVEDAKVYKGAEDLYIRAFSLMPNNVSTTVYGNAFNNFYTAGSLLNMGIEFENRWESDKKIYANVMSKEYARLIFDTARKLAIEKRNAQSHEKDAQRRQTAPKKKKKGRVHNPFDSSTLTERQRVSVETVERIAEAIGAEVYFYASYLDENSNRVYKNASGEIEKAPNGFYDPKDGSIHLDINAGDTGKSLILYTAAHELTHLIKDQSAVKFDAVADFLMEQYHKKGVDIAELIDDQIEKARENGRKIDYDTAYEEVVADSMETMLADGRLTEKLGELRKKDKGIVKKIANYFKKLAEKIRAVYEKMTPESREGQLVAEMVEATERLQDLFFDALKDISETGTVVVDSNDGKKTDVKYAERKKKIDSTVDKAIIQKGDLGERYNQVRISEFPADIVDYVRYASNDKIDLEKKYIALNGGDIWHEYKRHKNAEIETGRRQLAQTADDIKEAIMAIYSPDMVESLFSTTQNPTQRQAFAYAKKSPNGYYIVVEAVGGRKNPNVVPVMILQFTEEKWNDMMSSGMTLGEVLYENDQEKKNALDIGLNKKNRVTVAQFASKETVATTPRSPQSSTIVSQGSDSVNKKFSDRASSRSMLVSALEDVVQTEEERAVLDNYKNDIEEIDGMEKRLAELREEINEMQYTKGQRNTEFLDELAEKREEARKITSKLTRYDESILKLEGTQMLKTLISRERTAAARLQKQKNAKAKQRAARRREIAETKRKTLNIARSIESLLSRETKNRNIKEGMKDVGKKLLNLSKFLFEDVADNADIARLGIEGLDEDEKRMVARYIELSDRRDVLKEEEKSIRKDDSISREIRNERLEAFRKEHRAEREAISKEISRFNNVELKEIFARERRILNKRSPEKVIDQLEAAYRGLQDSQSEHIKDVYSDLVLERITDLKNDLKDVVAGEMTLNQTLRVYEVFKMVKHTITQADKLFTDNKNRTLSETVDSVQSEVARYKKDDKRAADIISESFSRVNSFTWNNLKPAYAFRRLGSETFERQFMNVALADGIWAQDIDEARIFIENTREKHGYDKWDKLGSKSFIMEDGRKLVLTLGNMQTIYALMKRDQASDNDNAMDHMRIGGFKFVKGAKFGRITQKAKEGLINTIQKRTDREDPYRMTTKLINDIVGSLTDEQKAYVDDMQSYMSNNLSAKGNSVSMKLFGIELFKEKSYMPIQSVSAYLNSIKDALNKTETMVSLKNTGMTKPLTPGANNPIVLREFEDVVFEHIDTMAKYHAYVLPIEDMQRIFNASVYTENNELKVTKAEIEKVFGGEARSYFENYIRDLNGANRGAGTDSIGMALFSRMKKTKVAANLSVAIQQPFAITRAMAMIDPRYFVSKKGKTDNDLSIYEEMRKYAPLTIVKEIGGYDMGSSRSAVEFMGKTKFGINKVMSVVDDISMKLPEALDRLGWSAIWVAVKNEIADTRSDLSIGGDAYFEVCNRRFTEVITYTQVYDSVNSRSGLMRSKSELNKFATSFMGEPTTMVNMMFDAWHNVYRAKYHGDRAGALKKAGRTVVVLGITSLLTKAAVSLIYALRDDDEDEAYLEKYMQALGGQIRSELNPFNSIPYARDIVSIIEGWDVERPDLTAIADMVDSARKLWKAAADKDVSLETVLNCADTLGDVCTLPIKNVRRDAVALWRAGVHIIDGKVGDNLFNEFWDGLRGKEFTNKDRVKQVAELVEGEEYKTATEYVTKWVENRALELAEKDGYSEKKVVGYIKTKYQDDAKSDIRGYFNALYKDEYLDAVKAKDTKAVKRIRVILYNTGLYDVDEQFFKWRKSEFEDEYKEAYKIAYGTGDTRTMERIEAAVRASEFYDKPNNTLKNWRKAVDDLKNETEG